MWGRLKKAYLMCVGSFWSRQRVEVRERYFRVKVHRHMAQWREEEGVPPKFPWERFPGQTRWNQGNEEAYLRYVFRPWWDSLTPDEQLRALSKTDVPDDWMGLLEAAKKREPSRSP